MYTPEEIRNILFTKSMGGYKTAEVDAFIDRCADTVEALINEKAELSKKLEVLADKLVEYRNEEDSIRTALLSAQRLGDTVVREANHKAGLILEDANIKAGKIVEIAERDIKKEKEELLRIQKEVSNFKSRMLSIYREHLSLIDLLPEVPKEEEKKAEETPAPVVEETVVETPSAEKSAPVQTEETVVSFDPVETPKNEESVPEKTSFVINIPPLDEEAEETVPLAAAPTTSSSEETAVSRFADLKFGDEYDISQDEEDQKGFFKKKK